MTSNFQGLKLTIMHYTHLEKDALHIYVGLILLLVGVGVFKLSIRSVKPLFLVLFFAVLGELIDRRDNIVDLGYWRWQDSVHDIINTLFWPTILVLMARFTTLFQLVPQQN